MSTPTVNYPLEIAVAQMNTALASFDIAVHAVLHAFEVDGDLVRRDVFDIEVTNVSAAIHRHLDPFFETIGYPLDHDWVDTHLQACLSYAQDSATGQGGV